jgi:hypothetical protein
MTTFNSSSSGPIRAQFVWNKGVDVSGPILALLGLLFFLMLQGSKVSNSCGTRGLMCQAQY